MEGKKKDNSRINKTEGEKINVNTKILKGISKKSREVVTSKWLSILFKEKKKKKESLSPKYLIEDLVCEYIQHKKYIMVWNSSHKQRKWFFFKYLLHIKK